MAQIFVFGRVTADLTLKTGQSGSTYLSFNLAENIGYGDRQRTQYYQVWAWDTDAPRLVRAGVKRGSLLWIAGSLELVDCTEMNGEAKTKLLKVSLNDWGFVPVGKAKQNNDVHSGSMEPPTDFTGYSDSEELDGDREFLPE